MNSGQGVLWIILWICLNSELLRYHGVQNFAKNDTENAELADAQTVRLWAHNAVFHALRTTQLLQMRPGHDVSPAGCGIVDINMIINIRL